MKTIIRQTIFTAITLYILSASLSGITIRNLSVLLLTSFVFTILHIFVKPILKVLFLPVNIITFGLFSWVLQALVLYLAILVVPGFDIQRIHLASFSIGSFEFASITLSRFWSITCVAFLISFGNSVLGTVL
ncbi:MAG: hypothetical protein UX04_C0001G0006 [Microgenomates group bacterium GW2011_GWF2_45_18]|nr:MAG: hypothetical protein UW18_C0003G0225 [Microgenomates group bacterium GW2011_GWF1_44_10]KKU02235.1 MAG: hypothetical protein UX04_C0001G0006 [Microgenomates group bacterium GW2011_GWF2_45_18]OGJ40922.1 MAG: hypothetical protein A2378_03240 [Candidatus Pacebacteria bacterium RIFOXYB1_FULL_44_10]HAU98836.1 hypothetical protein [Candidatus Paceibacterota bacterium]HAX01831.1 hypothetical protein [Candidatus Paceibacterota bacterium]